MVVSTTIISWSRIRGVTYVVIDLDPSIGRYHYPVVVVSYTTTHGVNIHTTGGGGGDMVCTYGGQGCGKTNTAQKGSSWKLYVYFVYMCVYAYQGCFAKLISSGVVAVYIIYNNHRHEHNNVGGAVSRDRRKTR